MSHFFVQSIKIGFLLFSPFFYSPSYNADEIEKALTSEGRYFFKTKGAEEINLQGTTKFSTSIKVSPKGVKYSVLKLDLKDKKSINGHSFGFIVSEPIHKKNQIEPGSYSISGHINGFLNYFEGVFGFANIAAFGETPYFAKQGFITIKNINQSKLEGYLDVIFVNPDGEQLSVNGSFDAQID